MSLHTTVIRCHSASDFLKRIGHLIYEREAEYSLLIGIATLRITEENDNFFYFILEQENQVVGGGFINSLNLVMTSIPASSLDALINYLYRHQIEFPGVLGPASTVDVFVQGYTQLVNKKFRVAMNEMIYQLDKVEWPLKKVLGSFQIAESVHEPLILQWLLEFSKEAVPHEPIILEKIKIFIETKIKQQEAFIWLDEKKRPVAMNFIGRPTKNGMTVSAVYTPRSDRKKGYASALVAHTSQFVLDQGKKFCCLYTDLSNPTSNSIYKKLGYKEIASSKNVLLISDSGCKSD